MTYRVLADGLVAFHFAFILFVLLGGFLVVRWRTLALLHLPAVVWAAYTEFTGTICPLTPWENALRHRAGDVGYSGGFIEHHVLPLVYPVNLTSGMQVLFGAVVVVLNVMLYALAMRRWKEGSR
jgi:Protein of Unknown function (DUF2784)